jgi:GAF domain-containing protein
MGAAMDEFQIFLSELLLETDASRVTLRKQTPIGTFPVVAEVVSHGAVQMKDVATADIGRSGPAQYIARERKILIQEDVRTAEPSVPPELQERYGVTAQMVAPIVRGDHVAGVVSVHYTRGPRRWSDADVAALRKTQDMALGELERREHVEEPWRWSSRSLTDGAIQGVLDLLREQMRAQRCTLRQDVLDEYAFPVTHESCAAGIRRLYGDFTITQLGSPVIEILLNERRQVVQDDTHAASSDPEFRAMLEHYGGMRAQIVTPLLSGDSLIGVLSVHYLDGTRDWTSEEAALASDAAHVLATLLEDLKHPARAAALPGVPR